MFLDWASGHSNVEFKKKKWKEYHYVSGHKTAQQQKEFFLSLKNKALGYPGYQQSLKQVTSFLGQLLL